MDKKKKKRKRRPQAKKKSKAQPAISAAHEADGVDEDDFAYSAVFLPAPMASPGEEWCLKGTKEAASEGLTAQHDLGYMMLKDSRYAFQHVKLGLSDDQVELLPVRVPSTLRTATSLGTREV